MPSKLDNEKYHAKVRFEERFGIKMNRFSYADAVRKIQSGKARFLDHQSARVSRFQMEICGIQVIAVYDKKRGTIITFLTPEMVCSG